MSTCTCVEPSNIWHDPTETHSQQSRSGSRSFPGMFEELGLAKSVLKRAIVMLLDDAMVGFISYGTQVQVQVQVQVHELGFSEMSKVYLFRGSKDISKDQVLEQSGLGVSGGKQAGPTIQKGGG